MEYLAHRQTTLPLLAGLLGGGAVKVGRVEESSAHAACGLVVWTVLGAGVRALAGGATSGLPMPEERARPQVGRPQPERPEELEDDDRAILEHLYDKGDEASHESMGRACGRSAFHAGKRVRELKEWGLVCPGRARYQLTEKGRSWVEQLRS